MAWLKGLTELVLTHVRLTLQVDVLFDGNEIEITILMCIEVSGLCPMCTSYTDSFRW